MFRRRRMQVLSVQTIGTSQLHPHLQDNHGRCRNHTCCTSTQHDLQKRQVMDVLSFGCRHFKHKRHLVCLNQVYSVMSKEMLFLCRLTLNWIQILTVTKSHENILPLIGCLLVTCYFIPLCMHITTFTQVRMLRKAMKFKHVWDFF